MSTFRCYLFGIVYGKNKQEGKLLVINFIRLMQNDYEELGKKIIREQKKIGLDMPQRERFSFRKKRCVVKDNILKIIRKHKEGIGGRQLSQKVDMTPKKIKIYLDDLINYKKIERKKGKYWLCKLI